MSTYSEEDVVAMNHVLEALEAHPEDIHKEGLAKLKRWATHAGAVFTPPPAAKEEEEEEEEEENASEPDEERWTLDDDEPTEIPAKADEPSEAEVEAAMSAKGEATELYSEGKREEAVAKMSEALAHNPGNAMYWGLRALYYFESSRPCAALHDARKALALNPQNVRALRVRGTINRHLGRWEEAMKDLSDAQAIDYDDKTNETLKYVQTRVTQRHKRELARQEAKMEAARKRQEELRRQRQAEEAAAAEEESHGFGGMPGGM
ncbi:hypothetical protein ABL78_2124, partial [Leptomonas seymouri]